MEYVINLTWDEDAGVWIATSESIPGLVLESGSFDALLERIRIAAMKELAADGTLLKIAEKYKLQDLLLIK